MGGPLRGSRRGGISLGQRASTLLPAIVVFVFSLAYLLAVRGYGFQVEDEGTLLFQFRRVLEGQRPYLDFHTGYTPGFFTLGTAAMALTDAPLSTLRVALAVINAAAAAGLCEITRRIAGRWLAPIAPLLWLAFVPVYVGEFFALNVPYPTWPVTLLWIVAALMLISWVERPRYDKLIAVGLTAAATLWIRPNSGAFLLAGATWVVCAVARRESLLDKLSAMAGAFFMAMGVWYTFQFRWSGMDAFVHLLPVLGITVMVAGRDSHMQGTTNASCGVSLSTLALSFLLPTLAWMVPLYQALGHERFLFDVLLIGADYQSLYHHPHPLPEPYAAVVVLGCGLFAVAGRLVGERILPAMLPLLVLAAGLVTMATLAVVGGLAPEGITAAVSSQLENSSYWLALTANGCGLLWLALAPGLNPQRSRRTRAMIVATMMAVAMYLQMFPRSDFMHQITAVPLTIAVATALLARVLAWWARGHWPDRVNGTLVMTVCVWMVAGAAIVNEMADNLAGPLRARKQPGPSRALPATLPVSVETKADDELESIARAVAHLDEHTRAGEDVWSFPAASGLLYAAGRANPLPHDYWFPGRPDHAEERRVLEVLRASPPRYGITFNDGWTFFEESPAYFAELRDFLVKNYALEARYGRFDIMVRRDLAAGPPVLPPPATTTSQSIARMQEAIEPDMQARRQAARRWMEALTPEHAAHAELPQDTADAVRLLRALRDGGDLRAAGWALLGFRSDDPRVRREAVDAMLAMETSVRMHRLRLADDFDPALYRPFLAPWADAARELQGIPLLAPFAQAVVEVGRGAAVGKSAATAR